MRDISGHSGQNLSRGFSLTIFLLVGYQSGETRLFPRDFSLTRGGIALMQDQRNFQTTFCARRVGRERTRAFAPLF